MLEHIRSFLRCRRKLLTTGSLLYLAVELVRYRRLVRLKRTLEMRTQMSTGFDREAWANFFVAALRRDAALDPRSVENLVSNIFWGRAVASLSSEEVDAWLLMYCSTKEATVT